MYYNCMSAGVPEDSSRGVAEDRGVAVRRELLGLDGKLLNESSLSQGELAVVKVSIDTQGQALKNLVVEDLLPTGLEVESAKLKTSQLVPWVRKRQRIGTRQVEIRDDRVLVFADGINGCRSFYYVVRAVTRGNFVWPAVSCECMYEPAIRSRGELSRLVVE
jgi:uncharacterized protein YfaS (alpha-2-macroglobulin family)